MLAGWVVAPPRETLAENGFHPEPALVAEGQLVPVSLCYWSRFGICQFLHVELFHQWGPQTRPASVPVHAVDALDRVPHLHGFGEFDGGEDAVEDGSEGGHRFLEALVVVDEDRVVEVGGWGDRGGDDAEEAGVRDESGEVVRLGEDAAGGGREEPEFGGPDPVTLAGRSAVAGTGEEVVVIDFDGGCAARVVIDCLYIRVHGHNVHVPNTHPACPITIGNRMVQLPHLCPSTTQRLPCEPVLLGQQDRPEGVAGEALDGGVAVLDIGGEVEVAREFAEEEFVDEGRGCRVEPGAKVVLGVEDGVVLVHDAGEHLDVVDAVADQLVVEIPGTLGGPFGVPRFEVVPVAAGAHGEADVELVDGG